MPVVWRVGWVVGTHRLLNSDSLADTWEVERVGLLASIMHRSGEVMSLLGTPCPQLELPVSKNVHLFLH